ncbi:hypothetical protein [Rossellomorea aquimaris]|jgi:hypothetical protein|uniref:Uncharacterized protein n=1 Tax=Rossellomorea aquimaris TaxID=189382 RepID=A0A1J6WPF3_9BACI|nr:hypothetical protein [Rossellomorea aquimaris]OIU69799.1 hypothetical protein BHE18_02505 [Rossellomorea aquimaris]
MKPTKKRSGRLLFILSIILFIFQMGYLFLHAAYNLEYIDNRLFYVVNILIVAGTAASIFLLFAIPKMWKIISSVTAIILILLQGGLILNHGQQTKQIVSFSPDMKNQFVLKEDRKTGEAVYYRTYYRIFARPKEVLPYETQGKFKLKWLENDIATLTYRASDNSIHQYIGTYGARDSGISYSYVGPTIQGQWEGNDARIDSRPEGISINYNGKSGQYSWDNVVQFGTIAIVLLRAGEAEWTIGLNENFQSHSNDPKPPSGEITLYRASMDRVEPVKLTFIE